MTTNEKTTDIVVPGMDEGQFAEACRPKALDEEPDTMKRLMMFKCTGCQGSHFRHAGYMEIMMPLVRVGEGPKVNVSSQSVKICVKCRKSYVFYSEQMYDVTDQIDLEAWEKAEKELQKATGPGGEC